MARKEISTKCRNCGGTVWYRNETNRSILDVTKSPATMTQDPYTEVSFRCKSCNRKAIVPQVPILSAIYAQSGVPFLSVAQAEPEPEPEVEEVPVLA